MDRTRRDFLRLAVSAAAVPLAGGLVGTASAQEFIENLKETDQTAITLNYVDEADIDGMVPGQYCRDCLFWQGESGQARGACGLMQAKVAAAGWCSAWSEA